MNDSIRADADPETIEVVLRGGPADLPEKVRIQRSEVAAGKVRIPRYGGYEHFELAEPAAEPGVTGPLAFHWTMRTKIAE